MKMNVFIESTLNGVPTCHLELKTSPDATVDSLISAFCIQKGIKRRPQYVLKTQQNEMLDSTKTLEGCDIVSGDVLYLTTRSGEQHLFGFHNWWLLAAVSLMIGIVGLTTVVILYLLSGDVPIDYGIVFDAGSTHTTMVIYKWDGEKDNGTGQVSQRCLCNVNGNGISSYSNDTEMAGESLQYCLSKAKDIIPKVQHQTSHIYLGATAGMRILNLSEPNTSRQIMASVTETLASSGFDYISGQSRIITGQEEGVFGWITVNFLSQHLGSNTEHQTVGALDMGGASTQISFVPRSNVNCCTVDLRLYGHNYHVFSRSFLCFGMSELERRYHSFLISKFNESDTIINPCIQNGFNYSLYKEDIFDHLCTVPSPDFLQSKMKFELIGEYNSSTCESIIKELLDVNQCSARYKYCLNKTTIPQKDGHFMAFSGFSYVMTDLNITESSSLAQVTNKIEEFCKRATNEVKHDNVPNSTDYLTHLCFKSKYILILLTTIYNFENKNWNNLSFVNNVSNIDVGWSLGFMTNATNIIPAEQPVEMLSLPAFIVLVVVFVIFVLTAVMFGCNVWNQRSHSSSYQRFSQYGAI